MKRLFRVFEVDLFTGDFTSPVYTAQVDDDQTITVPSLASDTQYKWRCKDVLDSGTETEWSETQYFTTENVHIFSGDLTPVHVFDNPHPDATSDYYSMSVDICQAYSIIGAYGEDGYSGRVYIFDNDTGILLHDIVNPNADSGAADDGLGISVNICDEYCAAGAWSEDPSGAAYVFNNTTGALEATIINSTYEAGRGVCITDKLVMIFDRVNTNQYGRVNVHTTGTWASKMVISSPEGSNGNFGVGMAADDDYILISTYLNGYMFTHTSSTPIHTLVPPAGDNVSITSVAINSQYAFLGNGYNDTSTGVVYVFNSSTGAFVTSITDAPSTNCYFGRSISISEHHLAVSCHGYNSNVGRVYIYDVSTLSLLYVIDSPNPLDQNWFGGHVGMTQSYLLVGAQMENSNTGSAYLFK